MNRYEVIGMFTAMKALCKSNQIEALEEVIEKTLAAAEGREAEIMNCNEPGVEVKRSIARDTVKCKRGKISIDELYECLFVTLGEDTFEEVEKLLDKVESKKW
ncbi:MAG: hypothetical protein FWH07_04910 [Oscillospiraceae bacterium]|nr:hypothetical protein [Oscillospiraceae bacterium]